MQRRLVTAILAALALLALSVRALAGGWAVTTFDSLPDAFYAGQSYTLGYTIRQHGVTPISVDRTEIIALHSAKTVSFPGKADGSIGHYVANVYFPADGAWTWQVTQGPFAPQDLGTLAVQAPATTATSGVVPAAPLALTAPATAPDSDPVRTLLPFAAAAATALFGWRLVTVVRGMRTRASAS